MTGSQSWIFFLSETNIDAESLSDAPNVLYSFIPDSAQFAACHVHCAKVFAVRAATTHVVMFRVRSKTRKHVRSSCRGCLEGQRGGGHRIRAGICCLVTDAETVYFVNAAQLMLCGDCWLRLPWNHLDAIDTLRATVCLGEAGLGGFKGCLFFFASVRGAF